MEVGTYISLVDILRRACPYSYITIGYKPS